MEYSVLNIGVILSSLITLNSVKTYTQLKGK